MSNRFYLDHNASSPLLDPAKKAMAEAFELYGNPSSVHGDGRRIRAAIEKARVEVAKLLGARPQDVIWTSGGTEANNLALTPSLFKKDQQAKAHLFVSAIEHPSVLNGMRFEKLQITVIPVDKAGIIDMEWLEQALQDQIRTLEISDDQLEAGFAPGDVPILVSVMTANNETGVIQPIAQIAQISHKAGGLLHTDCVQALGKTPVSLPLLEADLISVSAHKIGGPQGAGALILKDTSIILRDPLVAGGGQELKRRGGTENVIGIIGFGAAAKLTYETMAQDQKNMAELRDELESGLLKISPDAVIFGLDAKRLPNVCCFAVPGFSAETQVIQMDLAQVSISSGSACSSGKVEQSHVLKAMGVADGLSFAALRISLGTSSRKSDVDGFLIAWEKIYSRAKQQRKAEGQAA